MAAIRKRGKKWQAIVRRRGCPPVSRVFTLKKDAETWARQIETDLDRAGLPVDIRELQRVTVHDLLTRYRDEVVAKKRCAPVEALIVDNLLRQPFAKLPLADVNASHFAQHRDKRLREVSGTTIRRELSIMQHAFDIARREWAMPIHINPLKDVKKPSANRARTRRLRPDEFDRIMAACKDCRNRMIAPFIRLAVETGMRRGEITRLRWENIDLECRTLHIPDTKNGYPRTIPLTQEAVRILRNHGAADEGLVFPLSDNALKCAWQRVQDRASLDDFHFHDFRHEAISRFFEMGLSVPEVALISGHRDYRMLARYTHLRAEDIVSKLG